MALFEDEAIEEILETNEESNKYLNNVNEGFKLIQKVLSAPGDKVEEFALSNMLNEIFMVLAKLNLNDELEIYNKLRLVESKQKEILRTDGLKGKKILGVGGKFSSGKSCFINSITNAELPEGQRPTTSIATYIVNSDVKRNVALTRKSAYIELEDQALDALTHEFFEKYKIGFSKLIQQLIVYTPKFTYPNIAILDTPGYSKSDVNKGEDSTDAEMARKQLQSIDYLIWLVDSVQGVITQRDIEFISTLNVEEPILFVFTKASLDTEDNIKSKIEQAKKTLEKCNKKVYDVIAYDSVTKEAVLGEGVLEEYLTSINEDTSGEQNFNEIFSAIYDGITKQVEKKIEIMHKKIQQNNKMFNNVNNIEHMDSLLNACLDQYVRLNELTENKRYITDYFNTLIESTCTER